MGNKILGKRSRSFYKGFNQRQLDYLHDKFESLSQKGVLSKPAFIQAYKMQQSICDAFMADADFDEEGSIEEYQFICTVSYLCNLTIEELGQKIFRVITAKSGKKQISELQLQKFSSMCLLYNAYITKTPPPDAKQIKKLNKKKFQKYDYDKTKSIQEGQFSKICLKDEDYKNWLFNMGFITKKQMEFQDQIYDLVDSDIGEEVDRHLNETNPNVDRIKRGAEHRMQGDDQFQVEENVGDEFVPVDKPWKVAIKNIKKEDFGGKLKSNAPAQSLTLDYVLGYRSFDCRNNLKFDKNDRIVYNQATLGIVMTQRLDRKQNEPSFDQSYLSQHKDDVSCLDIVGNTVVSGEVGSKPAVIMWSTDKQKDGSLHSSFVITKQLASSVGNVCLTPSMKLLAVVCNDENHKLVIYNLNDLKQLEKNITSTKTGIVCFGPLTKSLVFDIKFTLDEKSLVSATVKQLVFTNFDKGVINSSRGQFGNFSPSMALCLLPLQLQLKKEKKTQKKQVMLTGMGNGSIYFWEKDKCIKAIVGHSGSVSAICSRTDMKQAFISGDKTGKIIVWNSKLQKQQEINTKELTKNNLSSMIVALAQNSKRQILIGTKGSQVLLLKLGDHISKAKVVMSGHSEGTLWAMALHKKQPFLYTGGQDQRLIKWDYINTKKVLLQVTTQYKIRSLDYNSYSNILLVGFFNGIIQAYNPDTLQKIEKLVYNKIKSPDEETLSIVKFEHYGKYFGAAYSFPQHKLYVMGINDREIKPINSISLKEKILSFDFTKSKQNQDKFVRLNTISGIYEIYNISKPNFSKQQKKQKTFLSSSWDTHTTPYSPQLKGVYTTGVLQQDITCCARNDYYQNAIIVGDKYSKLKLFNYPTFDNIIYNKYQGHSNAVTAVKFAHKQKSDKIQYVVSIGGEEKSILVWRYDPALTEEDYKLEQEQVDSEEEIESSKVGKKLNNQVDDQGPEISVAERAGATDQYKGQIFAPTEFDKTKNPKKDNIFPDPNMQIHHVFGLRNKYLKDQVRNHCKFSSDKQHILFPTACLAVKMNIQTRKQDIYLSHKEDIVSFSVDKQRRLLATGQMAQKNLTSPLKKILTISIWDIEKKALLQKLDGFHTIAIVLLEFSPSGKLLFTCGNDDKNTFAVYDWKANNILYSGPVSQGKVNGISWKNELQFATCGNDHVKFWSQSKSQMGSFKGKFQSQVCCISSSDSVYITGGAQGNIFSWSGNTISSTIKAHAGKVQCLYKKQNHIFSGGDDGLIKKWRRENDGSIKKQSQLFIDSRQAFTKYKLFEDQYGILSLDFANEESEQLLFATKGSSAVHYNKKKFRVVTQGHYKGQLWGLATNQSSQTFYTAGDDKTIRQWDISRRQQVNRCNFDQRLRAVDWSNNGKRLVAADYTTQIFYLDTNLKRLGDIYKTKTKKQDGWVEQIKFSPCGKYIVYGTHGNSERMEFLKVDDQSISLLKEFKGGSSAVLHIDWSTNSQVISINTQAHELLFRNLSNGQSASASAWKNQKWATWTQKFGFPVQGIFQSPDYTDINAVCRDPTSTFLAVGYDDQTIRLFKYPCYIPKQVFKQFYGHSSHVTRIRFSKGEQIQQQQQSGYSKKSKKDTLYRGYMVSTGGEDKTIIVWKYDQRLKAIKKQEEGEVESEESDGLDDLDEDIDVPMKIMQKRKPKKENVEFYQEADEGDQFMAVKPWLGAIKEPTYAYPNQTGAAPKAKIQLHHVHGYRTKDCRQNLYYVDKQTVLYHAAAVLIYHNLASNKQTLFTDHNDDILSIDYNRNQRSVITGQIGPHPLVNYYVDKVLKFTFKGPVKKGILACAINPQGTLAAVAGMDDDHQVAVLDLKTGTVRATKNGGKKVILKLGWVNDDQFVSVGIKHYKYWTVDGKGLSAKQGKTQEMLVSLAIDPKKNLVLVGGSAGKLYTGMNGNLKQVKVLTLPASKAKQPEQSQAKAATNASVVESIVIQQQFIAAGTKSGYVFIMDKSFKVLSQFSVDAKVKSFGSYHPSVRSLDYMNKKLLVGTFGSEIFEIQAANITAQNDKQTITETITNPVKAHYSPNNTWTNEVWGLSVHGDLVFSCSDDATIRCWSIKERKLKCSISHNLGEVQQKDKSKTIVQLQKDKKTNDYVQGSKARSILLTPDRKFVIVGSKDGRVKIYKFNSDNPNKFSLEFHLTFKHAKQWISDIKFGYNLLIIGSHDNGIYVYDYEQQSQTFKRKYRPLQKHSSYITHVDVSRDSCFLQSTCGAYQLLFWDLNTGKQITSGATMLRDERWASWTCNLGWPVQGIYPKCTDGTFIHSVDRSHTNIKNQTYKEDEKSPYLLAGGNNNGKVCIYSYPSTIKNSKFVEGKGHSSHITNVRWSEDDQYIISVGGEDQCVMYWKVTK